MKRFSVVVLASLALCLFACGGGGDDDGMNPDADNMMRDCVANGGDDCFELPTESVKKANGSAANYDCMKDAITMSAADITVNGVVEDFQTGDPVSNATVEAFYTVDDLATGTVAAMTTADGSGAFSILLPQPVPSRLQWKTSANAALDTYGINIGIDTTQTMVTQDRGSVSELTANALPAFIGVTRTPGLGVLAGSVLDCDGDEVTNAIATVSSTSSAGNSAPTFVEGAQVYYFSNGDPDLPVRRTQQKDTNADGLFVIIEIPPTSGTDKYYLQVWGFTSDGDVASGMAGLKLLSELQSPVVGDSVISVDMSPTEGPL